MCMLWSYLIHSNIWIYILRCIAHTHRTTLLLYHTSHVGRYCKHIINSGATRVFPKGGGGQVRYRSIWTWKIQLNKKKSSKNGPSPLPSPPAPRPVTPPPTCRNNKRPRIYLLVAVYVDDKYEYDMATRSTHHRGAGVFRAAAHCTYSRTCLVMI